MSNSIKKIQLRLGPTLKPWLWHWLLWGKKGAFLISSNPWHGLKASLYDVLAAFVEPFKSWQNFQKPFLEFFWVLGHRLAD
jgi:hypothetical protein